jgi:hypothetical protein
MSDEEDEDEEVELIPHAHTIVPAPHDTPLGTIWPPVEFDDLPPGGPTKYWLVVWIPDHEWRYMCVELTPPPEPEQEVTPPQQPPAAKPI